MLETEKWQKVTGANLERQRARGKLRLGRVLWRKRIRLNLSLCRVRRMLRVRMGWEGSKAVR